MGRLGSPAQRVWSCNTVVESAVVAPDVLLGEGVDVGVIAAVGVWLVVSEVEVFGSVIQTVRIKMAGGGLVYV